MDRTKEKASLSNYTNQMRLLVGLCITLGILLTASIATNGFSGSGGAAGDETGKKVIDYVNTYLLQGQGTAVLKDVKESDGLYAVTIELDGRSIDSYATKNGRLFFTQAIDLEEKPDAPKQDEIPKTDKPLVQLFTMSYCPYGNQAEEAIIPVAELLQDAIEIEPHYVIYSNYGGGGPELCIDKENKYCSMHGIEELKQDVRELCIYKYQRDKYWDYVGDVNTQCTLDNIAKCWETVAKSNGVDTARVASCLDDEAEELLAKEVELNKKHEIQGSPMLLINGIDYTGQRTAEAYKQAVCSAFAKQPEGCEKTLDNTAATAKGGCG